MSSFIALNERSMASFENFSLLPPIVSPGYFVGICKEEEEARGGACPCRPPSPLDIPVAYVANEIPARGGGGKNFQPARETS